jgi:feruloyl-CoA synthase
LSQQAREVPAGPAAPPAARDSALFGRPALEARRHPDGTWRLRSAVPLGPYPPTVLASLRRWAAEDPDYPLIAERDAPGRWRTRSYGDVAAAAQAAGQGLLDLGLRPGAPLLILSGNSVDHLVVSLAAMTAGIPVAPVSTAYSLLSSDHARIREITALTRPGGVFAEDADRRSSWPAAAAAAATAGSRTWRRLSPARRWRPPTPASARGPWPRSCSRPGRRARPRAS